ncbi:MAG: uncharacterized protein KVP18_001989 [Porospora cf. gigantea A]|uniref:uncharacterized protein n=1 Tax=Porospora cf. gigantea A TaxID=2853593 RepID=UPI00355A6EF2|nr:MAG: hypothetical protein KVP18_001989 [Porospora cf. gigantea A]
MEAAPKVTLNISGLKKRLADEEAMKRCVAAPEAKRPCLDQPKTNFARPGKGTTDALPLAADTAYQEHGHLKNFSGLVFHPDSRNRPLIVCPTGYIVLETFHPTSPKVSDFMVTIAEPLSRPTSVHEFQVTVFSLYAAISVGVDIESILSGLRKFSKNELPDSFCHMMRQASICFGRVKLVLRDTKYYIEGPSREDLESMLRSPTVSEARIRNTLAIRSVIDPTKVKDDFQSTDAPTLDPNALGFQLTKEGEDTASEIPEESTGSKVFSFEVREDRIQQVMEAALNDVNRPLVSEYDFRKDTRNANLSISLKSTTKVRYYQERALRKMFGNGRARSGIIVLPCGAGKTLTGITAATTIRKSVMCLTSSSVAVDQWRRSFLDFTTVDTSRVVALTAGSKVLLPDDGAAIVCSTYTMLAFSGKRSEMAERIIQQIRDREWGLLVFDEVQFAPAPAFRRINDIVKSHCRLGLTATLVREDELIHDLQWLIGPKLYEANWLELQNLGYLARVQCSEVWCPMTAEFYRAYLTAPHAKQRKLWVLNPNKLMVCEFLVRFHEERGDKVIVFSDNLFALKEVAFTLKRPYISGEVTMQERMLIIHKFKTSSKFNCVFLSKVGDNAIDIPCANVVIQISFNFASRRQEAQRLGRILRPKPHSNPNEEFNAFFYSLVSKDTQEMAYADKRQQFIIDQGYSYKVLPMSIFPLSQERLIYASSQRQKDSLDHILRSSDAQADLEEDDVVLADTNVEVPDEAPDASLATLSGSKRVRGRAAPRTDRTTLIKQLRAQ